MASNFVLSNVAAPLIELFSSSKFWSLYKAMTKLKSATEAERENDQNARLIELIKVSNRVKYWADACDSQTLEMEKVSNETIRSVLKLFPVSTKQTYASGFPDQVTVPGSTSNWQYLSSAGTTDRMTVVTDFLKRDYLRAAEHFNLSIALGQPFGRPTVDIPPSACNVVCGLSDSGPEPLLHYLLWAAKKGTLLTRASVADIRGRVERQILFRRTTFQPIDPAAWEVMSMQLDAYLSQIAEQKIVVLRAYPLFLYWLAKRAKQKGDEFETLKVIIPYGGLASESLVREIEQAFKADFVNVYGTGEVGAIGVADSGGEYLDVNQGLVFVEILDDEDMPLQEGQVGNIVVTDLCNHAMPIIRYKIGDIGLSASTVDGSVHKLQVLGRKSECFITKTQNLVSARDLQNLLFGFENILNFKVEKLGRTQVKASLVALDDSNFDEIKTGLSALLELDRAPILKRVAFITPESSGKYLAYREPNSMQTSGL